MTLMAAMCAGRVTADATMLRTGGFGRLYGGVDAPSNLGSFLARSPHGHVPRLQGAARRFTANLIPHTGRIPPGEAIVFPDIKSKIKCEGCTSRS